MPNSPAPTPAPQLMPHQRHAVDWILKTRKGLFAHEPGCGKTLAALTAIHEDKARRVLVVAPSPLLTTWQEEAGKWYPHTQIDVVRLPPKERARYWGDMLAMPPAQDRTHIVLTSYETMRADVKAIRAITWDAIVYDETLKIQSPTAKVTKAALSLHAPLKIAMNGTPLSNSWADLWPVMTWLEPLSLYGNFYRFRAIHAVLNPHYPAIVGWRDTDTIKARTQPLRDDVKKTDVIQDLPECTTQTIAFDLSAEEVRLYKRVKDELVAELSGEDVTVSNALVKLLRLRQAANGTHAFGGDESSKIDAACELLASLPEEAKAIVFTTFKDTARAIAERLGSRASLITGDTSPSMRDAEIEKFRQDGRVLVGTDAIAYGLNLQEASYVLNLDSPWSFAKYEQRIGRAWRKGQKNAVTVYNFEANGTVDAYVRKILEKKMLMADEAACVTKEDISNIINM